MGLLLHRGLERAAGSDPERVAVFDGDRQLTYGELEIRANRLAHALLDLGVRRGDRLGLYLDKSPESLVGIYGSLKAGAAYVPLDPQAPQARVAYIAADCGIRVLLSGIERAGSWADLIARGAPLEQVIVLNAEAPADEVPPTVRGIGVDLMESFPASAPALPASDDDLAYILYTSGSTGQPKGVMLSHRNGSWFVDWAVREFEVKASDRLSSHAPLHFDLSIFDVFGASRAGASVVLVPPSTSYFPVEVARFIERHGITVWYSVPSILNMLVERGGLEAGRLADLRVLLFAGEVFPTRYLRRLMALLPHVRFANLYGPTETNVCTWYDVEPIPAERFEPVPIGRAIAGVETVVLKEDGHPVARGEVGELHVGGPTVMQGYWGDPEKTAASLLASAAGIGAGPVYRTGDVVRENPDGNLELLGRRDHQIKTRGYRVELGEIESVLLSHPGVLECAVIAVPDPLITNRIGAHLVGDHLTDEELAQLCSRRLPRHMIPETFTFHPTLPKTSTGKIDRRALQSGSAE
jgi:amino acid adenylation domain-containing protein